MSAVGIMLRCGMGILGEGEPFGLKKKMLVYGDNDCRKTVYIKLRNALKVNEKTSFIPGVNENILI